jgi:hypothetical protein
MSTVPSFTTLLNTHASVARFYRSSDAGIPCPCRTPEGFRDPGWHLSAPPDTPLCNEAGLLPANPIDVIVKAFVQPIQSTRATRLSTEYIQEIFGNVEADDHLGIFPVNWGGKRLEFNDWSQSGDDFIEYSGERFFCINANMIPDPGDGNPEHHWEVGLRLIRSDGLAS